MTTIDNTRRVSLFVDQASAFIPYCEATLQLNERATVRRAAAPFSSIHQGKFRRLFDRHTVAFRR